MVITESRTFGTIGGGNLEATAIRRARNMLGPSTATTGKLENYALGPSLAQCCGGSVDLLFEPIAGEPPKWVHSVLEADKDDRPMLVAKGLRRNEAVRTFHNASELEQSDLEPRARREAIRLLSNAQAACTLVGKSSEDRTVLELFHSDRIPLVLFGAGHVGRAIARVLDELPFKVTWVDSRPQEFPAEKPENVEVRLTPDPLIEVDKAEPSSLYLVLTHSHQLDLALCGKILERDDFAFLGLIGSKSKRKRFESQLEGLGFSSKQLQRLVCPIGIAEIHGKRPAEIAVAVAAQLLVRRQ